jgi:hypothetical protein
MRCHTSLGGAGVTVTALAAINTSLKSGVLSSVMVMSCAG